MVIRQIQKLDAKNSTHQSLVAGALFQFLIEIYRRLYPNFEEWYFQKFFQGFVDETRFVFLLTEGSQILGVSIIKVPGRSTQKNKICTFFLLPEARGIGLGKELLIRSLCEFDVQPRMPVVITVSEDIIDQKDHGKPLLAFLGEHGFRIVAVLPGRYIDAKVEYVLEWRSLYGFALSESSWGSAIASSCRSLPSSTSGLFNAGVFGAMASAEELAEPIAL